jgi:hypothetical protein
MLAGHPTKKPRRTIRRQTEKTVDPFAYGFSLLVIWTAVY